MEERGSTLFEPVPRTVEELLDPHWLTQALADVGDGERVVAVEPTGDSQTLAQKVRFAVDVEDAAGGRRRQTYCAKGHFDGGPDTLGPEARFYADLAPRVGIRTPRTYYTGLAGDRAIVVMDDVVADGGTFLDAFEPFSVDTARDSLTQLARLHADTWGDPVPAGCEWLNPGPTRMLERLPVEYLQTLLDDGRAEGLAPELRDAGNLVAALGVMAELPPTCVLHGDTHSGNVYLDAEGRACWLDWQVIQPGHWSSDVAYHLGTVLTVEDRRAAERELLAAYLEELARLGVDPPGWDEAWNRYTAGFSFGFLLWVITTVSARERVLLHLPRLGAAMADHDTYGRLGVT